MMLRSRRLRSNRYVACSASPTSSACSGGSTLVDDPQHAGDNAAQRVRLLDRRIQPVALARRRRRAASGRRTRAGDAPPSGRRAPGRKTRCLNCPEAATHKREKRATPRGGQLGVPDPGTTAGPRSRGESPRKPPVRRGWRYRRWRTPYAASRRHGSSLLCQGRTAICGFLGGCWSARGAAGGWERPQNRGCCRSRSDRGGPSSA
jgi:hypothetical protein